MQEMVGKIQKATVGLFEGILQSRSKVSISGIPCLQAPGCAWTIVESQRKIQKNKNKTLWIFSCSGLLHALHELQELWKIWRKTNEKMPLSSTSLTKLYFWGIRNELLNECFNRSPNTPQTPHHRSQFCRRCSCPRLSSAPQCRPRWSPPLWTPASFSAHPGRCNHLRSCTIRGAKYINKPGVKPHRWHSGGGGVWNVTDHILSFKYFRDVAVRREKKKVWQVFFFDSLDEVSGLHGVGVWNIQHCQRGL